MFKYIKFSLFTLFLGVAFSKFAFAESFTIDMLNKLGKDRMVYSEKVISVKVNDEIIWKSVDKGHNVEFIGMPKGASKYKLVKMLNINLVNLVSIYTNVRLIKRWNDRFGYRRQ